MRFEGIVQMRLWWQRYWQVLKARQICMYTLGSEQSELLSVFLDYELTAISIRLEQIDQACSESHYRQVRSEVFALDGDPVQQQQLISAYRQHMLRCLEESHQLCRRALSLYDQVQAKVSEAGD